MPPLASTTLNKRHSSFLHAIINTFFKFSPKMYKKGKLQRPKYRLQHHKKLLLAKKDQNVNKCHTLTLRLCKSKHNFHHELHVSSKQKSTKLTTKAISNTTNLPDAKHYLLLDFWLLSHLRLEHNYLRNPRCTALHL
mgnify:FL=1